MGGYGISFPEDVEKERLYLSRAFVMILFSYFFIMGIFKHFPKWGEQQTESTWSPHPVSTLSTTDKLLSPLPPNPWRFCQRI